jgi:hypothetical protein
MNNNVYSTGINPLNASIQTASNNLVMFINITSNLLNSNIILTSNNLIEYINNTSNDLNSNLILTSNNLIYNLIYNINTLGIDTSNYISK